MKFACSINPSRFIAKCKVYVNEASPKQEFVSLYVKSHVHTFFFTLCNFQYSNYCFRFKTKKGQPSSPNGTLGHVTLPR